MAQTMLYLWVLIFPGIAFAIFKSYDDSPENGYYMQGDINLGIMLGLTRNKNGQCGTQWSLRSILTANAAIFRINVINNDISILPNISLGVVILDECRTLPNGLYQVTKLIPKDGCTKSCCDLPLKAGNTQNVRHCYNIAAAVVGYRSHIAAAQSQLLSMYKIPHISGAATADILSDRNQFEYFNRRNPPTRYIVKVMMRMVVAMNWTYISLIGSTSVYSRNGIAEIRALAKKYGICIAYYLELNDGPVEYDNVIKKLKKYSKARAVIMFGEFKALTRDATLRAHDYNQFIFVGPPPTSFHRDAFSINNLKIYFSEEGKRPYKSILDYYKKLSPWAHYSTSGVLKKHALGDWLCRMDLEKGENGSCLKYEEIGNLPRYHSGNGAIVDLINILVYALDTMMHQNCPSAFNDKSLLGECITGQDLLGFVRNTTFEGYTGHVEFDAIGDGLGDFQIRQIQRSGNGGTVYIPVGKFVTKGEMLYLDTEKLKWFSLNKSLHLTPIDGPESVCAKPCKQGEFYIMGEEKCCWECRHCRDNEVVRDDLKGCEICPLLTWPDLENLTRCEPIPPSYMNWLDPIAVGLLGLSGLGLLSTFVITYVFLKHNEKKVIKGSSLEQMMIILVALYLSYTTAILIISKPVYYLCLIQYYSFHLSCTLTFVPLLLKTTRIYRIFAAAERCQQNVRFVSSKALGLFSLALVGIVLPILVVCTLLFGLEDQLQMPISTQRFVELVCHISSGCLLIPLSYNLLLLLLCAVYGFLTRKLPENFNESWYIFISVSTTLFVWLAFLPTYSMAFYAYHKSALLGLTLILNAAVTAVCLFVPKIYAIYYIPEENIKITNFEGDN